MNDERYVSLWLGKFDNIEELSDYIEVGYTEDGDLITSVFQKDFQFEDGDEDFMELEVFKSKKYDVEKVLNKYPFGDIIFNKLESKLKKININKFNTIILLYHVNYSGKVISVKEEDREVIFVGADKFKQRSLYN